MIIITLCCAKNRRCDWIVPCNITFTFHRGLHRTTIFFSFFWTYIQSFTINSSKIPQKYFQFQQKDLTMPFQVCQNALALGTQSTRKVCLFWVNRSKLCTSNGIHLCSWNPYSSQSLVSCKWYRGCQGGVREGGGSRGKNRKQNDWNKNYEKILRWTNVKKLPIYHKGCLT